jgi:hypothetical protein
MTTALMNKHFDIYKFLEKRPLSYSAVSCFADPQWGSPEKWYDTYILGKRQSSKELTFGTMIDKLIQEDPTFCPQLPRYPHMQYQLDVVYKDIPMTGKPDGLDLDNFILADYKSGRNPWDKKKADTTEQLTAYLLFIYLKHKIAPEKFTCKIHWIPTKYTHDFKITYRDKDIVPVTFETKRTMLDLLKFMGKVESTVKAMQAYVRQHR